jgi:putative membrane protein
MRSKSISQGGAARVAGGIAAALALAACARGAATTGGESTPSPASTVATTEATTQQSTLAQAGDSVRMSGSSVGGTTTTTTEAGNRASSAGPAFGARSDANIVALLHQSNLGEIQAGTLAQQRATDAGTRTFAQQMVTEHTALDQRGNALATSAGITPALPNDALPQQQAQETAMLQQATGAAFDRAYLAQQVAAHQRTLALVDASIPMASAEALRTMLTSEVRPRVADHLRMAQELQRKVGTAP